MFNYKEIMRLHFMGLSLQEIGHSCGCNRSTVSRIINKFSTLNLTWNDIADKSVEEIAKMFHPKSQPSVTYQMPDYKHVANELSRPGVTLQLLWLEYTEECQAAQLHPYKYTQFRQYYYEYIRKQEVTMHLEHKKGDILQVDWCGTTLTVKNKISGKDEKAYIFVATLPFSGYSYAEAFLTMNETDWLTAHIHAYTFFGGVTRILVPDNLKTGVIKNTEDETILNKSYSEMAEYYGTAIIPARPRTPKDKAAVEGTVGKITTSILAPLRNNQYFTLVDLNVDILLLLKKFNENPFQKMEGSRFTRFEEERPYLRPLPAIPYELGIWKTAIVQFNYHVVIDNKNYSCPYEYVKKEVNVRISPKTIEIYYGGNKIASHLRLKEGMSNYSTVFEHMPPDHQFYQRWNGKKFRSWAKTIGEKTAEVVEYFLTSNSVEEQGYKSCITLLGMSKSYSKEKIEEACSSCLMNSHRPTLSLIRLILKAESEKDKTPSKESHGILRGSTYYSPKGED